MANGVQIIMVPSPQEQGGVARVEEHCRREMEEEGKEFLVSARRLEL